MSSPDRTPTGRGGNRGGTSLPQHLLDLQASAGNEAVTGLVAGLQRQPDNSYIRVAGDITSTFESGGDYGKLQTQDAGVISYGKHQATLSGGNLYEVVKDYVDRSSGEAANTLRSYLPRLQAKDATLAGERALLDLLRRAGKDPDMRAAQDAVFKRKYWDKAVRTARGAGITSALGHALLYDTTIQGGVGYRMKEVRAKLGGAVGDIVNGHEITELEFLTAFVEARIAAGIRQSERDQQRGRALLAQADGEPDAAKAAALRAKGQRLIANGKAMLTSATKTRGPTWRALVASGDLALRGDEAGIVTLVGKRTTVRGLTSGATVDGGRATSAGPTGGAAGGATPSPTGSAGSATATAAASPAGEPAAASLPDLLRALLPAGFATGAAVDALLRVGGADLPSVVISTLASAGYRDVNDLTNIGFWLRHPELAGTKLVPGQPQFAVRSRDWLHVRDSVVAPALREPRPSAPPTGDSIPALAAPGGERSAPPAPETTGTGADLPTDDFVHDWAASTIDRLPPAQRDRFRSVRWGRLDFPGTKVYLRTLTPTAAAWWRSQPSVREDVAAGFFTGTNQDEAEALLRALASARPGGGERRVNIGNDAVLTKEAFALAPQAFDDFVTKQVVPVSGQAGHRLNRHAAEAFATMRAAAAADGVPLVVASAFRPRSSETTAAKAARNPKAVGAFSPHSLGLAVDLRLHVKGDQLDFVEISTKNFPKMLNMLHSPVYKWLYQRGAEFGFYQYRAEPWHWEYNPNGFKDRFFDGAPELQAKVAEAAAAKSKRR